MDEKIPQGVSEAEEIFRLDTRCGLMIGPTASNQTLIFTRSVIQGKKKNNKPESEYEHGDD